VSPIRCDAPSVQPLLVHWGRGGYVWNNDKDTATLRTASGTLKDSCSYNSTRYDYKMC